MKSFLLELKSFCRSFKFLALFLVLLSFQLILYSQSGEAVAVRVDAELKDYLNYQRKCDNWLRYWQKEKLLSANGQQSKWGMVTVDYHIDWYEAECQVMSEMIQALQEKDWQVYNRCQAEISLFNWNIHLSAVDQSNPRSALPSFEQYFGDAWDHYASLITVREPQTPMYWDGDLFTVFEQAVFESEYHLQLLANGLTPSGFEAPSPWAGAYLFLRDGLPLILAAVVLLITVVLLPHEKTGGAIKTKLQRPRGRSRFLTRKLWVGVLAAVVLVLLPLMLSFLVTGVSSGFQGYDHPVLVNDNIFRFSLASADSASRSSYSYLIKWSSWSKGGKVGLSQYTRSISTASAINHMHFIPIWQFLGLALIELVLFIIFCSALGMLLSVLIKNHVAVQICALGAFAAGISLYRLSPLNRTAVWDLFAKANSVSLLEGGQLATYLHSLAALATIGGVFFGAAVLIFRKQDITAN